MSQLVPPLHPKRPALPLRVMSKVMPGVRAVLSQIGPYTAWWDAQNQDAARANGPLLVAIGDSTAMSIGASAPERGYVGQLVASLRHQGQPWRVINLGMSGAKLEDGLERQLPILADLEAAAVVCCLGTNDVMWGRDLARLRDRLRQLVNELPTGSIIGSMAGSSSRAQTANRILRNAATVRGHVVVNPWNEPGPPTRQRIARDLFHPNDTGYRLMSLPFGRALGVTDSAVSL